MGHSRALAEVVGRWEQLLGWSVRTAGLFPPTHICHSHIQGERAPWEEAGRLSSGQPASEET